MTLKNMYDMLQDEVKKITSFEEVTSYMFGNISFPLSLQEIIDTKKKGHSMVFYIKMLGTRGYKNEEEMQNDIQERTKGVVQVILHHPVTQWFLTEGKSN